MTNARLFVLGLLAEKPMHGYEIKKNLEINRTDMWAQVLPGSIYYALKSLTTEGNVRIQATEHAGNRSIAVYELTPQGEIELGRHLKEAWSSAPNAFPTSLYTALAFVKLLPASEIHDAVGQLIQRLEEQIELWKIGQQIKADAGRMNQAVEASFVNGRKHLEADLEFSRALQKLFEL